MRKRDGHFVNFCTLTPFPKISGSYKENPSTGSFCDFIFLRKLKSVGESNSALARTEHFRVKTALLNSCKFHLNERVSIKSFAAHPFFTLCFRVRMGSRLLPFDHEISLLISIYQSSVCWIDQLCAAGSGREGKPGTAWGLEKRGKLPGRIPITRPFTVVESFR